MLLKQYTVNQLTLNEEECYILKKICIVGMGSKSNTGKFEYSVKILNQLVEKYYDDIFILSIPDKVVDRFLGLVSYAAFYGDEEMKTFYENVKMILRGN